jgi:hypothetical protein
MKEAEERLAAARRELGAGNIAQALILLFNAATEAEQEGNLVVLQEVVALATAVSDTAEGALKQEATRLVGFWEPTLRNLSDRVTVGTTCPDCGREINPNAVRCRACGSLLV